MDSEPCCTSTFIVPLFKVHMAINKRNILGMVSVNKKLFYNIMSAFIGWARTHNPRIKKPMCLSYRHADREKGWELLKFRLLISP